MKNLLDEKNAWEFFELGIAGKEKAILFPGESIAEAIDVREIAFFVRITKVHRVGDNRGREVNGDF